MKLAGAVHLVIWVLDAVAGNGHANDARRTVAMKMCPRHNDVHTYNFTINGVCAGFRCFKSDGGNTDEVFIQPETCPGRETPCPVSDRKRILEFPRCCPSECGVDRAKRKKRALPVVLGVLWIGFKILMAATGRFLIQQSLKFAVKQLARLLLRQDLKNIKNFAINAITNTVKADMRGGVRGVIKRTVDKAVAGYKRNLKLIKKGIKKRQKTGNEKNTKVGKGKKKKKKEKKRRRKKQKKESCECDDSASITIEKGKSSDEKGSQGKEEDEDEEGESEEESEEESCELEPGDDGEEQCVGEEDNKGDPEEELRALYDA